MPHNEKLEIALEELEKPFHALLVMHLVFGPDTGYNIAKTFERSKWDGRNKTASIKCQSSVSVALKKLHQKKLIKKKTQHKGKRKTVTYSINPEIFFYGFESECNDLEREYTYPSLKIIHELSRIDRYNDGTINTFYFFKKFNYYSVLLQFMNVLSSIIAYCDYKGARGQKQERRIKQLESLPYLKLDGLDINKMKFGKLTRITGMKNMIENQLTNILYYDVLDQNKTT